MVLFYIIFSVRFTAAKCKPNKIRIYNKNMHYKRIYNVIGKTVHANTLPNVKETALMKNKNQLKQKTQCGCVQGDK